MLTTHRIPLKDLASLCRRLATSIDAGVDDRRIWSREAEHASAPLRDTIGRIRDAVSSGEDLTQALAHTGTWFPPLVHAMVAVGEQSGRMGDVLRRLADHYEHQLKMRRVFLSGITWPAFQLMVALGVVGLLIWIGGVIGDVDLVGLGLSGTSGLVIYMLLVVSVIVAGFWLVWAFRGGAAWVHPYQQALLHVPLVGQSLQTVAMARLAATLHLTLESGMDLNRLIPLAFRSAGYDRYGARIDQAVRDVTAGRELHDALRRSQVFPEEFLNTVENGEQSGKLAESLGHMAKQYEDQARTALHTLTVLTGFIVWAMVALIIVLLIFRLASLYFGALQSATTL